MQCPKVCTGLAQRCSPYQTITTVAIHPFFCFNPETYSAEVSDSVFLASVRFTHRRFLRGQAILAVNIAERSWIPRAVAEALFEQSLFLRVLRGFSWPILTVEACGLKDLRSCGTCRPQKRSVSYENCGRYVSMLGLDALRGISVTSPCSAPCIRHRRVLYQKQIRSGSHSIEFRSKLVPVSNPVSNGDVFVPFAGFKKPFEVGKNPCSSKNTFLRLKTNLSNQ